MSREIRSPVYQIDFTAVDAGKRIASSKRRIRWRFGFTNQDSLAAGETGTACRGEEHDITLIWSLTSGKRLVLADGQEVHYSNSRSQVFDFSWTMRGNHVLKVVAHAATPMNAHPAFRQYDFFVDGMSFFSMPKVYRLGLTGADPVQDPGTLALAQSTRLGNYANYSIGDTQYAQSQGLGQRPGEAGANAGPSSIVEIEAPTNAQEEEAYLREAIKASLSQDNGIHTSTKSLTTPLPEPKQEENLLIDFMSEPGPAPTPAPSAALDSFAMVPAQPIGAPGVPPVSFYAIPQQASVPVASQIADPYMAPPVQAAPSAPVPAYNQSFAAPPAPFVAPVSVPIFAPAPETSLPSAPAPESAPSPAPFLTMTPQTAGLGSDANAAYAKFASMDQFDLVKPKTVENRSNPFDDPVSAPAPATSLADMKAKNYGNGEKKGVMKNVSMVVAQQQAGNWGGYSNNGMPPAAPAPGQYGMPSTMGMQPPMQQTPAQQIPQYGSQYGGFQQQPPMQYQQPQQGQQFQQQYQQPQQGYGQPQQPF